MTYLIVGLGNTGVEYERTRHNIGFLILDRLADDKGSKFQMHPLANAAEVTYQGRTLWLVKPTTYMNLSGKAVKHYLRHYQVRRENLLVVTDDIALPYGKIRLKPKGSAGGHNGLKSIEQCIGSQDYPRLKFGVGNDFPKGKQSDYVLSPFTQEERKALLIHMDYAVKMIFAFCTHGIEHTMNRFN